VSRVQAAADGQTVEALDDCCHLLECASDLTALASRVLNQDSQVSQFQSPRRFYDGTNAPGNALFRRAVFHAARMNNQEIGFQLQRPFDLLAKGGD